MKMPILMTTIAMLACLSGCAKKVAEWEKDYFYQGEKYFPDIDNPTNPRKIIKRNIRSVRIYDEFDTLGIFDVLLLSDEVRHVYMELHARRMGFSPEAEEQLLRRINAEHQDALSFYVVGYAPGTTMLLDQEGNAPWAVLLKTPNGIMQPRSVRSVDLNPEYKYLLGDYLGRHKTVYLVKFEKPNVQFELQFTMPDRSACLSWDKPAFPEPDPCDRRKPYIQPKPAKCAPGRPAMYRATKEIIVWSVS